MSRRDWSSAQVRLVAVFLLLVLLPSCLLGFFCLRAVENERRARAGRVLENYQRYAEVAARAVHQELTELESAWQDLVPPRVAWEARLPDLADGLDSIALAERFVRATYVLDAKGEMLVPQSGAGTLPSHRALPLPTPAESRLFETLLARGEAAEFDRDDPRGAIAAYREMLARVRNPRLRAIAHVDLGRALLRAGDWDAALVATHRVLAEYPAALDFDNQPLRFLARLQIARAHEEKHQPDAAAQALFELESDLVTHSDEISRPQFDFFAERIDAGMQRLAPHLSAERLQAMEARRAARLKRPVSDAFYVQKLSRKLARAVMDETRYSPRLRYISDVADGGPFLLAYHFLPDRSETRVAGLAGHVVDLSRLSGVLLPGLLKELELSEEGWLEIVDETGNRVIGERPPSPNAPIVTSNLGEPFEFWNVAVRSRSGTSPVQAVDIRTKVFLYGILLLLLTIVAGAWLVTTGLRREARLANQKTTFVSNVSHELRTPLTSIRMYAEMLEMAEKLPETERRRQLAVIRSECGRLERLIDAVLDFASLQRGVKRFQFEYEEIGALVQSAAEEFRDQAEAQGFNYRVEIEPDLPEVRLDADAIRQVLFNLLSNALKYADSERWIAVRAFRRGGEVGVQVEDHGIGIDPREHERIFEDFYRVDQRLSNTRQGVGLGLTLVRRIVEAHQGRIGVESTPGRGARFTVWLPAESSETGNGMTPGGRVPQEA